MPSDAENAVSGAVIGAAMRVHAVLGPGLLEHAYSKALAHELRLQDHAVRSEVTLAVEYRGFDIDLSYRLDLIVDDAVIVEVKAVDKLMPVHRAQLLSYLRLTRLHLGLVLNFNVPRMKQGIHRVVNDFTPDYWR
mgnify:CR=1 FL=1